jgi:hypothetical protein
METKSIRLRLSAPMSMAECQRLNFYHIFHKIWRSSSQKFVRIREFRENRLCDSHMLLTAVSGFVRLVRVLHDRLWRSFLQKVFIVMSTGTTTALKSSRSVQRNAHLPSSHKPIFPLCSTSLFRFRPFSVYKMSTKMFCYVLFCKNWRH